MNTTTELTKEGDLVLLYVKEDSILPVYLKKDAIFNCRFGQFHHNNLINIPFGSIVHPKINPRFIRLLYQKNKKWVGYIYFVQMQNCGHYLYHIGRK